VQKRLRVRWWCSGMQSPTPLVEVVAYYVVLHLPEYTLQA
jgi:hypothetical protein